MIREVKDIDLQVLKECCNELGIELLESITSNESTENIIANNKGFMSNGLELILNMPEK